MFNRLDCRRTKAGRPLIPDKCEFQPAAAEKMPGLKGMTKAESTSANLHSSGWAIGSGTFQLDLLPADHGKNVVCMLRHNSERVARI
jgi:hypothetical protein